LLETNGMGQSAFSIAVQMGAENEMLYNPADEFKKEMMFAEDTSKSVCMLKNLSTNDIVNEFVRPLVANEREEDRTEDKAISLLADMTFTKKGDPAT
jgi:hypothetical protein